MGESAREEESQWAKRGIISPKTFVFFYQFKMLSLLSFHFHFFFMVFSFFLSLFLYIFSFLRHSFFFSFHSPSHSQATICVSVLPSKYPIYHVLPCATNFKFFTSIITPVHASWHSVTFHAWGRCCLSLAGLLPPNAHKRLNSVRPKFRNIDDNNIRVHITPHIEFSNTD